MLGKHFATAALLTACLTVGTGVAFGQPQQNDGPAFTSVPVPKLPYFIGDVIAPLPGDAPYPSGDPRDLEGIWASLGAVTPKDGPAAILAQVRAQMKRVTDLDNTGSPVVAKGTLCRADGIAGVVGNQFPTQIVQRPDEIILIGEEGRKIFQVYMNAAHPANFRPSHLGHSIGYWEGNTLVIDTVGQIPRRAGLSAGPMGAGNTAGLHVVTRIARANTGDKRNGDRLVMEWTVEDPGVYERPYTTFGIARWRPDLEMLEFNCEESSPEDTAQGVKVE